MTTIFDRADRADGEADAEASLCAAAVARYLQAHPEFFNEHAQLLQVLAIPHVTGSAVSLWERQIAALREENERQKLRFDKLIEQAKRNEALIRRVHGLVLDLMATAGPEAIFALLDARLCEDFKADRATALIFAPPAFIDGHDAPQFVGDDAGRREPFADLIARREASCGRLTAAQALALFGAETAVGSHVLLALKARAWSGVLAISSNDPLRFDASMGTEFLTYLRDVITLVLDPWVGKPLAA